MQAQTQPTLMATARHESGKGVARKLRAQGLIPAVCYGTKQENVPLSINPAEFDKILSTPRRVNSVFSIEVQGGQPIHNVMLRDYQIDPVRRNLTHVDLIAVDTEKPLEATVPVEVTGRSKGERAGGKLRLIHPMVRISARPLDIPESIVIDVTELDGGASIMASQLAYPENVKPAYKMDYGMVNVIMPRKVKVVAEEKGKKKGKK